jgi:hypothetical protein
MVAATDRLLALSGQFAQRRLARPSHQLDGLLCAVSGGHFFPATAEWV